MPDTHGTGDDWLDLADAIMLLRNQIVSAQSRIADPNGQGDRGVRFGLGEITVELGMELGRNTGADGSLRFAVVGVGAALGGKRERTETTTHRVTVRLNPHTPDGRPSEVGDRE
ncbi:trypco2 family protein [Streptomyces sp. NRRL S-646]|uniref:trypco2 family protein n=1 Tax=Streptomyces sp. NRRL S-646 TaxID=1463917 RepID=UPI0004CA827D|nr:trypco2 family protein [Streptomyces sp. NRRL S-646]